MTEFKKLARLEARANAESSFLNSLKIMDYDTTKEVLDAANKAILSGVEPRKIVSVLEILSSNK